jgi:WhiB family redox-sensing transcriptional regulator
MKDWRDEALCQEEDPELFFPIGSTGPALEQIEQAKNICRRCPVTEECLRWALDSGQDAGVWGGMSEIERRELKRRYSSLTALWPSEEPHVSSREQNPRKKRLINSLSYKEREELSTN